MSESDLEGRVENLEKVVATLEPLPRDVRRLGDRMDRVETEIVQLRTDMNVGFSTLRAEMAEHARETAGHILETQRQVADMQLQVAGMQLQVTDMQRQAAETQRQVSETQRQVAETQRQVADTRGHMRVLHEEVIERISRIGKG